jgi:lyso-ornithine lipid O-acyltransferase
MPKYDATPLKRVLRLAGRGMIAAMCVAGCLIEYCGNALIRRMDAVSRARVLQKWSARLLSGINLTVTLHGGIPQRGLIASNHLSYLDILVFSAVCGCVFVSKREVKSWPAVGWISSLAGTIYIDRTRRAETHAIQPEIQSALSRGLLLVLFPEGTSSDGSRVLHFHSSLFQPALDLDAPMTAAAVDYFLPDGDAAREACYWGEMRLLPHLLNLLTKRSVQATLTFSEQHLRFSRRKEAAQILRLEVQRLRGMERGRVDQTAVYDS